MKKVLLIFLALVCFHPAFSSSRPMKNFCLHDSSSGTECNQAQQRDWRVKLVEKITERYGDHKRTVAAVLAFPVFGIVGLHRIYLGTKPYVPVVYIATLCGCLGILPLIDFVAIIFSDDATFEKYKNNPHVFMWAN